MTSNAGLTELLLKSRGTIKAPKTLAGADDVICKNRTLRLQKNNETETERTGRQNSKKGQSQREVVNTHRVVIFFFFFLIFFFWGEGGGGDWSNLQVTTLRDATMSVMIADATERTGPFPG